MLIFIFFFFFGWEWDVFMFFFKQSPLCLGDCMFQAEDIWLSLTKFCTFFFLQEMKTESTPLRCRKLSNPDIFSSAGKTKLHRQLSQDDCKLRRGSLASSLSGMPFCKDYMTLL